MGCVKNIQMIYKQFVNNMRYVSDMSYVNMSCYLNMIYVFS